MPCVGIDFLLAFLTITLFECPGMNTSMDYGLLKLSRVTRWMAHFAKVKSVIAFLRSETPAEDISANPLVIHPHNTSRSIPERLPAATVRELSALEPARALAATAGEWVSIAAAIALCSFFWHPVL